LVPHTTEDRRSAVYDFPVFRNPDFDASENGVCFQSRLLAQDLRIPQVDLASAENRDALSAAEILCRDVTFHAAEYRCFAFAHVIYQIEDAHQSNQADDEARASGKPRPWGRGHIRSTWRFWLHINSLLQVQIYRSKRWKPSGISADGMISPVNDSAR